MKRKSLRLTPVEVAVLQEAVSDRCCRLWDEVQRANDENEWGRVRAIKETQAVLRALLKRLED